MEYEDLKRKILMLEARARFDSEIRNAATREFNLMKADRDRFQDRYTDCCSKIADMEKVITAMQLELEARDMEDAEPEIIKYDLDRGCRISADRVARIREAYQGHTIEFIMTED